MRKGLCGLLVWSLMACSEEPGMDKPEGSGDSGRLSVYTVNYPLAWMARELAGDQADVEFPAPTELDPAFWEPGVEVVLRYQEADLVLLNGANYARWLQRVSLPVASQSDTSRAYHDRLINLESGPSHSHGPAGEHSHGDVAFTTWLDLELAQLQLQAVAESLDSLLPRGAGQRAERLDRARQALAELDARLMESGRALNGAPILYSHPVYQYLQRRYRLNGRALHWEPGEMPPREQWELLEQTLLSHPARLMLWEGEPLPEVSARLEAMGIAVVVFDPLGNRPEGGDFTAAMAANIAALDAALDQGSG